ncbi:coiled-coil domain-containing protein 22 [Spartinivicinus ruber]|uniref:coiled-coil domain-containing protein 22 n=1 Tax=Spartinivicinus ruber TaxID=2683272 RepID=UPI0013D34430|nr:coiled-coil domain-containing protein 22 [Spartinivicinus ruber]
MVDRNKQHLQFDFDHFNATGLKPLVNALKKRDVTVTDIEGSKRAVRKSGVLTKKATLFLADGQKLIIEATAQGTIFQVKLNNQVLAIKHVDNLTKAVREIAGFVHKNSKSFQAKLRKMAERKRSQSSSGTRQATLSTQQQLADKQQLIDDYRLTVEQLAAELNELLQAITQLENSNAELTTEIAELQSQINTQQETLDQLIQPPIAA